MKYKCWKCNSVLNTRGAVILIGQCEKRRTMYVFDMEPGNYNLEVADGLPIEQGSVWEFMCPVCHGNLTTRFNPKLARVDLVEGETTKRVIFSKEADVQATFVLGGEEVLTLGKDYEAYIKAGGKAGV
jgi:hypothetical protein